MYKVLIHSFNICLLRINYVSFTELYSEDKTMNKREETSFLPSSQVGFVYTLEKQPNPSVAGFSKPWEYYQQCFLEV